MTNTISGRYEMLGQVNDLKVNYESKGDGDVIVFVHGLGGSLHIWNSQTTVCSRYYRTLSYDLRGSGRTGLSQCEYSIELWVSDLKELLLRENIEAAHLAGHSLGTLVVQHFAVSYPHMVKSLTLVGGFTEPSEAARKGIYDRSDVVRTNGMDAVADAIIEGGFSSYSKHTNSALIGLAKDLLLRNHPEAYAASCRALAQAQAIDHSKVEAPVLLIVGDEDKVSPLSMSKLMSRRFPRAQLEIIPNCGHWATIEMPDAVNKSLLNFLSTL